MAGIKATTIRVYGETWVVPRGFGAEYIRTARDDRSYFRKKKPGMLIQWIRDALGLIGYTASIRTVSDWPMRKRVEAIVYACNVHLRASDNPLRAHPRPAWFPKEPWKGPTLGEGIFETPGPTVIGPGERCSFHFDHDPKTDEPRGRRCRAKATLAIHWKDGRVSVGCAKHGLSSLDRSALKLVKSVARLDEAAS